MSGQVFERHVDEFGNVSVRISNEFVALTHEEAERLKEKFDHLSAENAKLRTQLADVTESMGRVEERCAKLRELATFALKHIIEFECEEPDRERLRGKPCEDCADYGSSDCPKCMPRMFDVSGIEVDA